MLTFFRDVSFYYMFIPLVIVALITGFTTTSRGRIFGAALGRVLNGVLVLMLLVQVVVITIYHGWPAGAVSTIAILGAGAIGTTFHDSTHKRMYRRF